MVKGEKGWAEPTSGKREGKKNKERRRLGAERRRSRRVASLSMVSRCKEVGKLESGRPPRFQAEVDFSKGFLRFWKGSKVAILVVGMRFVNLEMQIVLVRLRSSLSQPWQF